MNQMTIIQGLLEGGNARYIDKNTGDVKGFAGKMELHKIPRKELVAEMVEVLRTINTKFSKKNGDKLWKNFDIITSGKALNGSSSSLFNSKITDEEFIEHKPTVGDIDVTFPGEYMGKLWELLNDLEGTKVGELTKYLGHKNSRLSPTDAANQSQINAIFEIDTGDYKVNAQIDFEASEYENDEPTEWASFSHSSSWDDIKSKFKGVAHKFALLNLSRAQSRLDGIQVITLKNAEKIAAQTKSEYAAGTAVKLSTSKAYANPTNLAFSVAKGLRTKFSTVHFKDGEPLLVGGEPVFYEKAASSDKYETDLETIFKMIFGVIPDKSELNKFNSFVGVVELMKLHSTKEIIKDFYFDQLVSKTLFCATGCQGLERNNPQGDSDIKFAMLNHLKKVFPFLTTYDDEVNSMAEEYYKNYSMIAIDESLKSKSSLSSIFSHVNDKMA